MFYLQFSEQKKFRENSIIDNYEITKEKNSFSCAFSYFSNFIQS